MTNPGTEITATVVNRIPGEEIELAISGAPDDPDATGLRVAYLGQAVTAVSIITDDDEIPLRPDYPAQWPAWVRDHVDRHRPSPKHDSTPLYRLLADVMTELARAGEITPQDQGNLLQVRWDTRKRRFVYQPDR